MAKTYTVMQPATGQVVDHDVHHGDHHDPLVAHQFDDLAQQNEADSMGMWLFLATEVLFLSAMFTAYAVYRFRFPDVFAEASHHLNQTIGALNTALLLCSSLTVALAVHAAQQGHRRRLITLLLLTMLFGAGFLGVKGFEWYTDYHEGLIPGISWEQTGPDANQLALFFVIYFTMTGIHALHMIIGLGVFSVITFMAWRGLFTPKKYMPVELSGLYWHFVDIVWVFLFPLLYLIA